jgi:CRP-like cAMP-binding protein
MQHHDSTSAPRAPDDQDTPPSSPAIRADPTRNRLLAALPREAFAELAPRFERLTLEHGVMLHRRGEPIEHLYFPLDALISITLTMRDGRTAETGVAGCREVVGINAVMDRDATTQTEYVIQVAGDVVRVAAAPLRDLFERSVGVRAVLLRYTQAMLAQVSQNTACNGLHHLEQRYARWLLETRDRVGTDELKVTHEYIAQMLSVRRAGVTEVSCRFEDLGIVRQRRGRTRILDLDRLIAAACECYGTLAAECDRLLGPALTLVG